VHERRGDRVIGRWQGQAEERQGVLAACDRFGVLRTVLVARDSKPVDADRVSWRRRPPEKQKVRLPGALEVASQLQAFRQLDMKSKR
jgi:hypothetical protein